MARLHRLTQLRRATLIAAALGGAGFANAGELEAGLAALARMSPRATSAVIVELDGAPAMDRYAAQLASLPRADRPGRLAALMQRDFQPMAEPVLKEIKSFGGWGLQNLWIAHSISVQMPRARLAELAAMPGVKHVGTDTGLRSARGRPVGGAGGPHAFRGGPDAPAVPIADKTPAADSIDAMNQGRPLSLAPHFLSLDVLTAWQSGHAGEGVTLAVVDTGVDLRAPTIARGFRGRTTDWFDPYGQQPRPIDFQGHGTLVAGLLVGGLVGDTPVGVAPQARWMAARLFDDAGKGSESAVQRIYQWVLDPDGNPSTADAPDIVNNSWGLPQSVGRCNSSFARALAALRAADIHVVFAAGNDGPAPGSSMSPANNPGVLSVGALDADRKVAARSSRGPSACGSAPFPTVHAPGVNLPALDQMAAATGGAAIADGTSFAAAAVSGALAILRSAAPQRSSTDIEALLLHTARRQSSDNKAGQAVLSPDLGAALASIRPSELLNPPRAQFLRWQPTAERAGQPIEISAASLATVLPWSLGDTLLRPLAPPSSGQLSARGDGWSYTPDVAKPAALRFGVDGREGRRLIVELVPQVSATTGPAPTRRQTVRTAVNGAVLIAMDTTAPGPPSDKLRVSSPLRGGKVRIMDDGNLQYTPPANFMGTDQFTYAARAESGAPVAPTTVMVQVVRP